LKNKITPKGVCSPIYRKLVATSFSATVKDILDGNIDRNDLCAIEPGTLIMNKRELVGLVNDYMDGYLDEYKKSDVIEVAYWLWDNIPWHQSRQYGYTIIYKDRKPYMRAYVRKSDLNHVSSKWRFKWNKRT